MKNLSYLIIKVSRQLKNKLDNELKGFDITAAQFSVMNQINSSKQPITAAQIALRLDSDRPTISEIISRLSKKGMITKINNPKDKRSYYLQISEESSLFIEEITRISDKLNENIFSVYTKEETNHLGIMLEQLLDKNKGESI